MLPTKMRMIITTIKKCAERISIKRRCGNSYSVYKVDVIYWSNSGSLVFQLLVSDCLLSSVTIGFFPLLFVKYLFLLIEYANHIYGEREKKKNTC